MSQQADKFTESIAAAMGDSKPTFGGSQASSGVAKADSKIGADASGSLEQRLNAIIEERERVERDQAKLRSEAEQELQRISPEIENLEKEIERLRSRKQGLEGFLQRLAPKTAGQSDGQSSSQSPSLRRASFG